MPSNEDPADERGNTVGDAKAQEKLLDVDAPAATEEIPTGGGDVMVLAQTPEEVQGQIDNVPANDDDEDE